MSGHAENRDNQKPWRGPGRLLLASAVALMFGLALFVRLYDWGTPTMIAERQYRSALIARSSYLHSIENVPRWRLTAVDAAIDQENAVEPPVVEWLVSRMYMIRGGESLWIPRLFSTTFWLVGGVFLLMIGRRFAPPPVALILLAYYLLLPLGVRISMSFLPEPLMMMLFLASLLTMVRYFEKPTGRRLVACAVVSASAVLVKALCLFTILGAFAGLTLHRSRVSGRLRLVHSFLFLGIIFLLGCGYYLYGLLVDDYMVAQVQTKFMPRVFLQPHFWVGWPLNAGGAVGYVPLILGLIGVSAHRGGNLALLSGLWAGYVAFCLVFAYHVQMTGYYHLQLIPVVALSAAPLVTAVFDRVKVSRSPLPTSTVLGVATLLAVSYTAHQIRQDFRYGGVLETPEAARRIGKLVDHSTNLALVSKFYGVPLEYRAEIAGVEWPRPLRDAVYREEGEGARSVAERLAALDDLPDYFVITDFAEFERHHKDLAAFLDGACGLVARSEDYLIYDTRDCVRRAVRGHDAESTAGIPSRAPRPRGEAGSGS